MQIYRISLVFKALQELGWQQVGYYALYQLGLHSGHYQRLFTKFSPQNAADRGQYAVEGQRSALRTNLLTLPEQPALAGCLGEEGQVRLLNEADEIVAGKVHLFGRAQATPLDLQPSGPLKSWTKYEKSSPGEDIKFTWEPARFGWAYPLGRAYTLSKVDRYAQAFWEQTETFIAANRAYLGPHWVSAQEVALRLIALVWSSQVFATSPQSTPKRMAYLSMFLAQSALRIPPTLIYARSQNNNHLLSEAAGLYTAGLALPDHPQSQRWRELGWDWFGRGLLAQIAEDGAYSQHSANYHRLMLQLVMWMNCLARIEGRTLAAPVLERLQAAVRWLSGLIDPFTGRLPNLGSNDGAYIMPLTVCPFHDYRPVCQAASQAFLAERPYPAGLWDEMSIWYRLFTEPKLPPTGHSFSSTVIRSPDHRTWAYLRAAHFTGRPGHADQLHLDLWWKGLNIAQDPGTYRYNAPPPWDNALTHTAVHNILTINGLEQMRRAGRFLYLERAQARIISQDARSITAQHDGYRRLGVTHQRTVNLENETEWIIDDVLLPSGPKDPAIIRVALQWLLVDSEKFAANSEEHSAMVKVMTEKGLVKLEISAVEGIHDPLRMQLVRAGELVYGSGPVEPTWGWSSPTYGVKIPALSVRIFTAGRAPLRLKSRFILCTSC